MTQGQTTHPLIEAYLRDLDRAARVLPPHERQELVAEIRGHLEEGLARAGDGEAAVRNLLDALGEPEAIVVAAQSAPALVPVPARSPEPRGAGVIEVLAVFGLLFGGFVIPIIGWFGGVILLWASRAWTTDQKLLGTFVVPGGLLMPFLLLFIASPVQLPPWLGGPVLLMLLLGPIVTAVYLLTSARRPPVAAEPGPSIASGAPAPAASGPGALEVAAVLGLLFGGVVIPVVGWFVGVVLLWASTAWTVPQKVLGTLIVPGGLGAPLWLGLVAWGRMGGPGNDHAAVAGWLGVAFLVALIAGPVAVAAHLLMSARRPLIAPAP